MSYRVISPDAKKSSDTLTPQDLAQVKHRGLDEDKAGRLKPYFARGLSAKRASGFFEGERGYSQRTLDAYWAAFNAAATSPLAV